MLEVKQKKCGLFWSSENSKVLFGRCRHLCHCCMEDGLNQTNHTSEQIQSSWGEADKNLHLAEIQQTEAQTQQKDITTNKEKSNKIIKGKAYRKSTTQTQTTPPKIENLQNKVYIDLQSVYQKLSKTDSRTFLPKS